ncbi:MAG: carboxypeptidase-like regulatory domain-containing protein [Candidatus Sulfotelmatobacter sp.]
MAGRHVTGTAVTSSNGEYSFGEVPVGRYRIRIHHSGDPFCAPEVNCNEAGCSVQRQVKLNPKNKPEVVY